MLKNVFGDGRCRFGGGSCSSWGDMFQAEQDCVSETTNAGRGLVALRSDRRPETRPAPLLSNVCTRPASEMCTLGRDYDEGEQIFDFYGFESNLLLMGRFGFAVPGNNRGTAELLPWADYASLWEQPEMAWIRDSEALRDCVAMFDEFGVDRGVKAPELRLALDEAAHPHGFDALAVDCVGVLAQRFASEAELRLELARPGGFRLFALDISGGDVEGDAAAGRAGAAEFFAQVQHGLLRRMLEQCELVTSRQAVVRKLPIGDDEISRQLVKWIGAEIGASCVAAARLPRYNAPLTGRVCAGGGAWRRCGGGSSCWKPTRS